MPTAVPRRADCHLQLAAQLQTDDQGLASVEVIPDADTMRWSLRAIDRNGLIGRHKVTLACGRDAEDFIVRTDKAIYRGGETAHVEAFGGGSEPLFLDVIKDRQTVATHVVPIADGHGELQLDLPAELSGPLELCAYRYDAAGWPVRRSRIIYVDAANQLHVEAKLDRAEYRPGDRATLSLQLADERGQPVPGAVSLAAVDEAVYSVTADQPGMEQTFSTLESELLAPIYALYPAWSLGASKSPPPQQTLDQALFAASSARRDADNDVRSRLLALPDVDESLLDVLQRPDSRELAESMNLSPRVIDILSGDQSAHSLAISTYPAKVPAVERQKQSALQSVHAVWVVFGIVLLILVVARFATPSIIEVLVVLVVIGLLSSLLLPAIQAAREAGRRATAANDLRLLGLALEYSAETAPDVPADVADWRSPAAPAAVVSRDAPLAPGSHHRRRRKSGNLFRTGRLDHHLATLRRGRLGHRQARRRPAVDSRLPAVLRRLQPAGRPHARRRSDRASGRL